MVRSRSDDIRQRIAQRRKEKERIINGPGLNLDYRQNPDYSHNNYQKTNPGFVLNPDHNTKSNSESKTDPNLNPDHDIKSSLERKPNLNPDHDIKSSLERKPNLNPDHDIKPSLERKPNLNMDQNTKPNQAPTPKPARNPKLKPSPDPETLLPLPEEEDHHGFNHYISYEGGGHEEESHPLFRKEVFFFKLMAAACLFLVVAIMFRSQSPALQPAKSIVKKAMDTEFQFAAVTNWYENKFGKPLALLPVSDKKAAPATKQQYAVPASGRILENFQKNGQGIMIETGIGTRVEAMNEGLVTFSGIKEGIGKTVIIQHADKTESWYGNLDAIDVNLYQSIKKGNVVGTVSGSGGKDKSKGEFYFAIKKGDHFIDPIQVIRFE